MNTQLSNATTQTMSSVEIVKIINDLREDGRAELMHSDFMKKVIKVIGIEDAGKFSGIYLDAYSREKPCYHLPKREANLMVMSESYKVQAAIYDRMIELEKRIPVVRPALDSLTASLMVAESVSRMLRMSDTSTLRMVNIVCEDHGISTKMLPSYTDEKLTKALSDLLKEHGSSLSAIKANLMLEKLGIIEISERRSTGKTKKYFWSITDKGLPYGKNETSTQSPNQTQPRWYVNKFPELLVLIYS